MRERATLVGVDITAGEPHADLRFRVPIGVAMRWSQAGERPVVLSEGDGPAAQQLLDEAIPAIRTFIASAPFVGDDIHGQLSNRVAVLGYLADVETVLGLLVPAPDESATGSPLPPIANPPTPAALALARRIGQHYRLLGKNDAREAGVDERMGVAIDRFVKEATAAEPPPTAQGGLATLTFPNGLEIQGFVVDGLCDAGERPIRMEVRLVFFPANIEDAGTIVEAARTAQTLPR